VCETAQTQAFPNLQQTATRKSDEPTLSADAAGVKYRDPKTNQTWSGRGRMPNWLKQKQEAGEDIDEYRA
jgi:DNA-binding protein H-NS